jgi:hypothetical protein
MIRSLIVILLGSVLLGGCGSDPCEDAADKLAECGGVEGGSSDGECSGAAECVAECINNASCEEITSADLNSEYFNCVSKCGGG